MVNTGMMPATVVDSHIAEFWRQIYTGMQVQPFSDRTTTRIRGS